MYCENYYKKNCTSNNLSINLMRQKKKIYEVLFCDCYIIKLVLIENLRVNDIASIITYHLNVL